MRVFILEDDPLRMQEFRKVLTKRDPKVQIDHAESCSQVDRFKPPYDLICLDHDLGGRQMGAHEDNGLMFVRQIKPLIDPSTVILIHSWNGPGARNMQAEVGGLYYPFGSGGWNKIMHSVKWLGQKDE